MRSGPSTSRTRLARPVLFAVLTGLAASGPAAAHFQLVYTPEAALNESAAIPLALVFAHPFDNGIANFRRQANRIARRLKLGRRVMVMDGGHLPSLLSKSEGVVVVNSTTGLSALHHGRPVTVLGSAIFDLEGLTFKGPLDGFWREKSPPDPELFKAFRKVVLTRAQVNGSFFTYEGTDVDHVGQRLSALADNLLLVDLAVSEGRGRRTLRVAKARGTAHDLDVHELRISGSGVEVV